MRLLLSLALVSMILGSNGETALLVVDVQDCFLDTNTNSGDPGSLSVTKASDIIPLINQIRTEKSCLFDTVVRSQDFHTEHHISFGPTHGLDPFAHLFGKGELPLTCVLPQSGMTSDGSCCPGYYITPNNYDCDKQLCPSVTFSESVISDSPACSICKNTPEECFETTQAMWTNHCLQTGDSMFPPSLYIEKSDLVVQKGTNKYVDAYSAFMDNTKKLKTELDDTLKDQGVTTIFVVGIATDYCVYYSTMDALDLGYEVIVVLDATKGIADETTNAAVEDMKAKGATIVMTSDVLAMECSMTEEETISDGFLISPTTNAIASFVILTFVTMIVL